MGARTFLTPSCDLLGPEKILEGRGGERGVQGLDLTAGLAAALLAVLALEVGLALLPVLVLTHLGRPFFWFSPLGEF